MPVFGRYPNRIKTTGRKSYIYARLTKHHGQSADTIFIPIESFLKCRHTSRLVGTEGGGVRQLDDDSRLVYVGSESEFPSS